MDYKTKLREWFQEQQKTRGLRTINFTVMGEPESEEALYKEIYEAVTAPQTMAVDDGELY